jgi:hypothetical protein
MCHDSPVFNDTDRILDGEMGPVGLNSLGILRGYEGIERAADKFFTHLPYCLAEGFIDIQDDPFGRVPYNILHLVIK